MSPQPEHSHQHQQQKLWRCAWCEGEGGVRVRECSLSGLGQWRQQIRRHYRYSHPPQDP